MTNSKKLLLSLGTIASIAAPLATTVACGRLADALEGFQAEYDTENDGKIKLWSTFSSTGTQMAALTEVVEKYNSVKEADAQPVEIVPISDGYSNISPTLTTKFEGQDKKTLPNLVIGYPDSLGTVSRYNMHLDLGDENEHLAGEGVSKDLFDESFTNNNDEIGGIEEEGFYTIPLAKSIDMLTSNEPVLKHFADTMVAAGATVKAGSKFADIVAKSQYDTDIVNIAPTFPVTADTAGVLDGYEISDEIFADFEALLDFTINVSKVIDIKKDAYALGIDSITNLMYQYGYSLTGDANNPSFADFYFSKNDESGYIDYNFGNKDSNGYKNLEKIYAKLAEAVDSGAVFVRDQQYSSDFSKSHTMGLSVGSTAGYSYNYVDAGSGWLTAVNDIEGVAQEDATLEGMKVNEIIDHPEDATDAAAVIPAYTEIVFQSGSYTNSVFSSEYTGEPSNFDYNSNLSAAELKAKLVVGDYLFKHDSRGPESGYIDMTTITNGEALSEAAGNGYSNQIYFIPSTALSNADVHTLQESEMSIQATPGQFGVDGHNTTLLQGPSIFGVHSNAVQNVETRDFIGWLYGDKVDFDGTELMPAERFAAKASYILPTNDFLNSASNATAGSKAQNLAFDTIKSIKDNDDHYGFDNPVDYTTSNAREYLKSGIVASWNSWYNGGTSDSLEELYANLRALDADIFG